jgi:hypothetical protein
MGVRLNRCLRGPECLVAGEFTVATDSGRPVLCCPLCGDKFDLPYHCTIEPDGRAVPAVRCRAPACSFFDFVQLGSIWEETV